MMPLIVRFSFGVLAAPADVARPPADPRSRAVDVDGRSMTVTADAENSIVVEATTVDGVPFAIAGLGAQDGQLLELAASVVRTGERFTFTSGHDPPGWPDTGNTLSQLAHTSDGEFLDFVVWHDSSRWIGLSSPSRTVDELLALVPTVRAATREQTVQIDALARRS